MIRQAKALAVAFVFAASLFSPWSAAAALLPAHACCAGHAKKKSAAPLGSCCRQALPSAARLAGSAPAPVPALMRDVPSATPAVAAVPFRAAARVFSCGAAPPGPTGLSPPARA